MNYVIFTYAMYLEMNYSFSYSIFRNNFFQLVSFISVFVVHFLQCCLFAIFSGYWITQQSCFLDVPNLKKMRMQAKQNSFIQSKWGNVLQNYI